MISFKIIEHLLLPTQSLRRNFGEYSENFEIYANKLVNLMNINLIGQANIIINCELRVQESFNILWAI